MALLFTILLPLILAGLFLSTALRQDMDFLQMSVSEGGFNKQFLCRYSFSIHFFLIGITFLFLDLELCLMLPIVWSTTKVNGSQMIVMLTLIILVTGLGLEIVKEKVEWMK